MRVEDVEADARRDGRRRRSRARAGSSSSSSTAIASCRRANEGDVEAAHPQRQRPHRSLPRDRDPRGGGAAVSPRGARRRGGGAGRRTGGPASSGCSSAPGSPAPAEIRRAAVENPGDLLRLRPARLRGSRSARPAADRAQADAARQCCRRPARSATWITSRRTASGLRRSGEDGPRGHRGQEGRCAVRGGRTDDLAQDPRRPDRRLRRGRVHRSPRGRARGLRRAAPGATTSTASWSTPAASAAGSPRSELGDAPEASWRQCRRAGPAAASARFPRGPDSHLGRAAAGVRGAVQGVDRRAAAPPAGLPALARRQGAGGVRPADGHRPGAPETHEPAAIRRRRRTSLEPIGDVRALATWRRCSGPRTATPRAT